MLQTASQPDTNGPGWLSADFFLSGKSTEAILAMQWKLLEAYDGANRSWLYRVKSEAELWSELATKLNRARTMPEALSAFQECVAYRMQMAADDGGRLSEDVQKIMRVIGGPLSNGEGLIRSQAWYQAANDMWWKGRQIEQLNEGPADKRSLDDWCNRIKKLRWMGLEDEAMALQQKVRALPADERGSVLVEPFNTD